MHIIRDYSGLNELGKRETQCFTDLYQMTPDKFKEEYYDEREYTTDDLTGMYVISVSTKIFEPKVIDDGKYSLNILDVYTPRSDQKATLDYCGHIAFVEIKNTDNKRVALLYKDDECFPQKFDDWYENQFEEMECCGGITPTKQEIIDVIRLMIKAYCQNPDLDIDISSESIIVLQGL